MLIRSRNVRIIKHSTPIPETANIKQTKSRRNFAFSAIYEQIKKMRMLKISLKNVDDRTKKLLLMARLNYRERVQVCKQARG